MTDLRGLCPPQFEPVREAFAANFAEGGEVGAAFAVTLGGEPVIDLFAGHADRAKTTAWTAETLAPVFSTTKAMAALLIARAVGEGKLAYGQRIAELWPDFAANGKGEITVEMALSHQDGLAAFMDPVDPALWFDREATCAAIAAMAPIWPPGTASGYHPMIFGFIADQLHRLATGRSIGAALAEIRADEGLGLWIGLPDAQHDRVAQQIKPSGPAELGEITPLRRAAFLSAWSSPGGRGTADWRRMELPSANGHVTARDLAILFSAFARDGMLGARRLLAPGIAAEASRARICGQDLVLPFDVCWGAGVLRNERAKIYGPTETAFGHSGWGGSCVMADPEWELSAAYVMNRQSTLLIGDPRPVRLLTALYECL